MIFFFLTQNSAFFSFYSVMNDFCSICNVMTKLIVRDELRWLFLDTKPSTSLELFKQGSQTWRQTSVILGFQDVLDPF